uniref:CUB domain-containing protein n=1 Tax=Steinernema glaseri TaxID=37863 RepID=A0A1I8AC60_9BILA
MFAPATTMPMYTTCTAGLSRPTCHFEFGREDEFGPGIEVLEDSFATFDLRPKLSTVSMSRSGKIRRSVSSLHECTHSKNQEASICLVEARQIEIDFASLTATEFLVQITAPSGERSELLDFNGYGKTMTFMPKGNDCGHGVWTFQILQRKGTQLTLVHEETMYLDGVGSLFFTVGDDLRARLSSQEFLRLPSASRCCGRQRLQN